MKFFIKSKLVHIVIFGLLVTLCIEGLSRIFVYNDWILNTTSDLSSVRWRLLWTKSHSSSQLTNYHIDTYHETLGWFPLSNVTSTQADGKSITINADGIRSKKIYAKEKPINVTRIVVVGDSFSFGEDVSDDETYSAQLENILFNTEVLNMAVHGYGVDQMNIRLDVDGYKYHPDIVIYAFISDDLDRALLHFRDYIKPKYILEKGELKLSNIPIPSPEELYERLQYRPAIFDLVLLLRDRINYQDKKNEVTMLIPEIWKQSVNNIKKHNALPIFLYLPNGQDMINDNPSPISSSEELISEFCLSVKITCIFARKYLASANSKGIHFDMHGHYDTTAHAIIAEGLAKDIDVIIK